MFDGADPVRERLRTELLTRVLPWIVDRALRLTEITDGIERAGIDAAALRERLAADQRLLLLNGPEFAEVRRFARGRDGRIDRTELAAELAASNWPIRLGYATEAPDAKAPTAASTLHGALTNWCTMMLRDSVLPELRRTINAQLEGRFQTTLTIGAVPGLERSHDLAFTVRTASTTRFREAVARIHGSGALGLAGPRGSGKTALIDQYVAGLHRISDESMPIGLAVACPVNYEARDFVLHLHAMLCRSVIERVGGKPEAGQRFRAGSGLRRILGTLGKIVLLAVLGTVVLYLATRPDLGRPLLPQLLHPAHRPSLWVQPLLAIVAFVAIWLARLILRLFGQILDTVLDVDLLVADAVRSARFSKGDLRALHEFARDQLTRIKLLQTSTTGWSGTATLPWALTANRSRSVQLAQRAQTFPEAVEALRELIARCATMLGPVVIAIDELDKVASAQQAQAFVNEVKGIFGVPGCLYIVSVSEDALVTFERSVLGVRDAFDSAFDELVRLDYLRLADSLALVRSRVIGIPEPFGWLCHCLSGGLPRELMRLVRRVAQHRHRDPSPTLGELCATLVGEDLAQRTREFRVMASRLPGRVPTDSLTYLGPRASARDLLAATTQLVHRPRGVREPDAERRRLEAAMFAYHGATLKEVFRDDLDRTLAGDACAEADQPGTFDQLSRARSVIVEDPMLAWLLIDEFRAAWRLEVVEGR